MARRSHQLDRKSTRLNSRHISLSRMPSSACNKTQIVLAVVIEKRRVGAALAFVVAAAWTDPIDVAPIAFDLFFNDTATTEIYTLSLHDALPISGAALRPGTALVRYRRAPLAPLRAR